MVTEHFFERNSNKGDTMLDFKCYIPAVLEEINRFKWLESENLSA